MCDIWSITSHVYLRARLFYLNFAVQLCREKDLRWNAAVKLKPSVSAAILSDFRSQEGSSYSSKNDYTNSRALCWVAQKRPCNCTRSLMLQQELAKENISRKFISCLYLHHTRPIQTPVLCHSEDLSLQALSVGLRIFAAHLQWTFEFFLVSCVLCCTVPQSAKRSLAQFSQNGTVTVKAFRS